MAVYQRVIGFSSLRSLPEASGNFSRRTPLGRCFRQTRTENHQAISYGYPTLLWSLIGWTIERVSEGKSTKSTKSNKSNNLFPSPCKGSQAWKSIPGKLLRTSFFVLVSFWLPLLPFGPSQFLAFLLDKDAIFFWFHPRILWETWPPLRVTTSRPRKTIAQELSQSIMKWRAGSDVISSEDMGDFRWFDGRYYLKSDWSFKWTKIH